MQNRIILAVIYVVLSLLSARAFARCEEYPTFSHNDGTADIYYYHGQAITVLNNYTYADIVKLYADNPEYAVTWGNGYFIVFKKADAGLTMIYRTNTGRAAGIYNPNIFKELYRFNTCF